MELNEIIRKAQVSENRIFYCKKLFDMFNEFIIKQFTIYAPYTEPAAIREFVTALALEFFSVIENKFHNFKLKKHYTREESEEHLWSYFQTVADSILDRSLIHLSFTGGTGKICSAARDTIAKRYRGLAETLIAEQVRNSESPATEQLTGFELEEFWKEETRRLIVQFHNHKFTKIINRFDKDNSHAIFRKYMERSVKNFLADYIRGKRVKKMRRLILYKEDLPEALFETLKALKGHGNLFYYKKKEDCLTIRDYQKALFIIKNLNLPEKHMRDMELIFQKSRKRAEYQRIIDHIESYITEKCMEEGCPHKLTPGMIKILLYTGDAVMKKRLSLTEKEIAEAGKRLEKCVTCLKIDRKEIFYRI